MQPAWSVLDTSDSQMDWVERAYLEGYASYVRVAAAITGDRGSAHDCVQEGFARALAARSFDASIGDAQAWLWRIVVNTARDHARQARRRWWQTSDRHGTSDPPPAMPVGDADPKLRAALLGLTERQRLVVFLRYYADLSYDQIGETLRIKPGTVAATLNTAHAALRRVIGDEADE